MTMANKDIPSVFKISCFWCRGIASVGINPRPSQKALTDPNPSANASVFVNYTPCNECIEKFKQGVHVFEAQQTPIMEHQPALISAAKQEIYPTGRFVVLSHEAFKGIFNNGATFTTPTEYETVACDKKVMDMLMHIHRETGE